MVFGTFDIFHGGHKNMFEQARAHGDNLIVVIARDETVIKVKGKSPQNDEISRLAMIKQVSGADRVILGSLVDKFKRIKQIKPDVICLGYDQQEFTENLKKKLLSDNLKTKIIRLKAYKPEIYKTSKLI